MRVSCLALLWSLLATSSAFAVTVTGYQPSQWGQPDAAFLVDGYAVEDFEDAALAPGLQISASAVSSGSYGPTSTLPATFAPVTGDPNGNAFDVGVWDGTSVLINTGSNQSETYSSPTVWGTVVLHFAAGVDSVGFGIQQMGNSPVVRVNGSTIGALLPLAGLPAGAGRNGFARIDSVPGDPIFTLEIDTVSSGDGWVIDHLVFGTPPFSISGLAPANWQSADSVLGVEGGVVEEFEDAQLEPGLLISAESTVNGSYGPTATLPNVFDAVSGDSFGSAFTTGFWDGPGTLVNTGNNQSGAYANAGVWGRILLEFAGGTNKVGFSLQQMGASNSLRVNGRQVGLLPSVAGLSATNGRQGYIIITGWAEDIDSVEIDNDGNGDGWVIDHLVFDSGMGSTTVCDTGGDLNGDGVVNVADVLCDVLAVLAEASAGSPPNCLAPTSAIADTNCDGNTTISDVNLALHYSLAIPLPTVLDANANACPDACE